jgi:hypothetical protein
MCIPIMRSKLIFQKIKLSENCAVLGYCVASSDNFLPTFRDKMGPIGCPETSIRNYRYSLRNNPEEPVCHLRRGGSLKSLRLSELEFLAEVSGQDGPDILSRNVGKKLPLLAA